jgi:hypothetical protein
MEPMKRKIFFLIHLNFIAGMLYAAVRTLTTPRASDFLARRLWSYEYWIIFGFYVLFLSARLSRLDEDDVFEIKLPKVRVTLKKVFSKKS